LIESNYTPSGLLAGRLSVSNVERKDGLASDVAS
jgi:hypothetical protein